MKEPRGAEIGELLETHRGIILNEVPLFLFFKEGVCGVLNVALHCEIETELKCMCKSFLRVRIGL
jgi:hypothetical protein